VSGTSMSRSRICTTIPLSDAPVAWSLVMGWTYYGRVIHLLSQVGL
jgi:hypothetical protein